MRIIWADFIAQFTALSPFYLALPHETLFCIKDMIFCNSNIESSAVPSSLFI